MILHGGKTGSATAATDPGLGYFIWMNGNSPMAIQTDQRSGWHSFDLAGYPQ